jgi:RNA polymerase sigma factor (sigma-70 family)
MPTLYQNHVIAAGKCEDKGKLSLTGAISLAMKRLHKHNEHEMLKDEDAISFVAEAIMVADARYNTNIGNRQSYIIMIADLTIKKWWDRHKRQRNRRKFLPSIETNRAFLHTDAFYMDNPLDSIVDIEERAHVTSIIEEANLTEQELVCINLTMENARVGEIASKLNLEKQTVCSHIKSAKRKLQYARIRVMGHEHD